MNRTEILEQARKCVCGDREQDYGTPESNFSNIAKLWTAYKDVKFTPKDVAVMMALMKIARIKSNNPKEDNWVDAAGYIACGGEIECNDAKSKTIRKEQKINDWLENRGC